LIDTDDCLFNWNTNCVNGDNFNPSQPGPSCDYEGEFTDHGGNMFYVGYGAHLFHIDSPASGGGVDCEKATEDSVYNYFGSSMGSVYDVHCTLSSSSSPSDLGLGLIVLLGTGSDAGDFCVALTDVYGGDVSGDQLRDSVKNPNTQRFNCPAVVSWLGGHNTQLVLRHSPDRPLDCFAMFFCKQINRLCYSWHFSCDMGAHMNEWKSRTEDKHYWGIGRRGAARLGTVSPRHRHHNSSCPRSCTRSTIILT